MNDSPTSIIFPMRMSGFNSPVTLLVSFVASIAEENVWICKDVFLSSRVRITSDGRLFGNPGACHQWPSKMWMCITPKPSKKGTSFWTSGVVCFSPQLWILTRIGFITPAQRSWNGQSCDIGPFIGSNFGTMGVLLLDCGDRTKLPSRQFRSSESPGRTRCRWAASICQWSA